MSVAVGTRLGSLEITAVLGKGGMGEVYRARDTRLARDVAIKTLPEEFVSDRDRLARFQREAKLLASLNHQNIGAIYGLEEFNGAPVLILELVEGETLAERLKGFAVPAEDALKIAIDVADALEEAHGKGVIHRDLKPGNIKITPEGKVKVLDFGLAKALESNEASPVLSNSPTLTNAATLQGVILGTASYMSPEQAKGRAVTRAADIWAFGCVLFEMLAGRPAFEGEDVSEILASVIKGTTNLNLLPADLHPALPRVIKRCLEKDLANRFRDIGDVRYELTEILADPTAAAAQPASKVGGSGRMSKRAWITASAIGIVAAVAAWSLKPPPALAPGRVYHFEYQLPKDQDFLESGRSVIALSPDGSRILYYSVDGWYVRSMDSAEATLIATPRREQFRPNATFSPDGEWIAFWSGADRQLKKVSKNGGTAVLLASSTNPFGISWSADNTIFYAQLDGVWSISATGGKPQRIIEAEQNEVLDSPQLLPGGEWVLLTSTRSTGNNRWDGAEIVAASLKSKQRKTLWRGGSDGRYVPTGHLVFAFGNDLYAVPFDLKKLETIGGQIPIIQGVRRAANPVVNTSTANYAFSANGTLVYVPGSGERERALALVDRSGAVQRLRVPPRAYFNPRISPDEKHIVVESDEGNTHAIWVYDLAGSSDIRQLTLKGNNQRPIWMPDSRHVTFASDADGPMSIYTHPIDGSSPPERLTTAEKGTEHWPESWSADGSTLSFALVKGTDSAIWTVSPATRTPKLFADEPGVQRGSTFSPDGKWIAYHSGEGGQQNDIYVQGYPSGPKKRVTQDRRSFAVWSAHGNELFYSVPGGGFLFFRTFSLKDGTFGPEQALPLPNADFINDIGNGYRMYDPTPDGKRFLVMLRRNENTRRQQINIVLNWFEELKQRVPVR